MDDASAEAFANFLNVLADGLLKFSNDLESMAKRLAPAVRIHDPGEQPELSLDEPDMADAINDKVGDWYTKNGLR
jgi:hypothetical protein